MVKGHFSFPASIAPACYPMVLTQALTHGPLWYVILPGTLWFEPTPHSILYGCGAWGNTAAGAAFGFWPGAAMVAAAKERLGAVAVWPF